MSHCNYYPNCAIANCMGCLRTELERVMAERDRLLALCDEMHDEMRGHEYNASEAEQLADRLRTALEVAKKTIRESAYYSPRVESNANRALAEIERLEAGRGKE